MSNHMDVDVLPALPSGPRGVAGGLLERLEREALAEQARLEALERGERDPLTSGRGTAAAATASSSNYNKQGHGNNNASNDMPTYVPGQKRTSSSQQQHQMSPPAAGASAPISTTSTVKSHGSGSGAGGATSTSMQASTSSQARGSAALVRDRSTSSSNALPPSITNSPRPNSGTGAVPGAGPAAGTAASSPQPPPAKRIRIQPTIRMSFTFPPYPPGREPLSKQVPVFNVHNYAEREGLLLPPEDETVEEASSSGGSDDEDKDDENEGDNEGGDSSMQNVSKGKAPNETESQQQLRLAIELAKRQGRPVLAKKRILERDEGYDATDPFVDDSDLAMNEPKVQARPKVEGFIAIQGEVEVFDNNVGMDGKPKKGRKFGSVNKPKVPMLMPDGSTKMVSEAVADREGRKASKAKAFAEGGRPAPASSASESPAPQPPPSSSSAYRPSSSTAMHGAAPNHHHMSPSGGGSTSRDIAGPSRSPYNHASFGGNSISSITNSSSHAFNPNGPLMSRDAVSYSHLPSSSSMADQYRDVSPTGAHTPPPQSHQRHIPQYQQQGNAPSARPSLAPSSTHGSRASPINIDDDGDVDMSFATSTNGNAAGPSVLNRAPSSSNAVPQSTSSTPAAQLQPPQSRPSTTHFAFDPSPQRNREGKRIYETHDVSPELEAQLDILREAVSKESFIPRNKFPPSVKPVLMDTALVAMRTGEYDENFFNLMPNIFPYNRFTMHKMIKREICDIRSAQLEKEILGFVEKLRKELDTVIPEALASFEQQKSQWWEEYVKWRKEKGTYTEDLTPDSIAPQTGDSDDQGPIKPVPKFKFTPTMRMHLFSIMSLSTEIVERLTDKAEVEERDPPSAMNATKARYSTLVQLWPEGWMTSNQLSRELTQAKKKVQSMMVKEGA